MRLSKPKTIEMSCWHTASNSFCMRFCLKTAWLQSTRTYLRIALLMATLFLFAFTDSDYFKNDFDFPALVSRYETLPPSADYSTALGIEVEGYYTEKRNTDDISPLGSYKDLAELTMTTLKISGFQNVHSLRLHGSGEKSGTVGVFYSDKEKENVIRLVSDSSIHHPQGTTPVEFISPILSNPENANVYYSLLRKMASQMQFESEPINSGTHLHFDFKNPKPEEMLILTIIIEKILPELQDVFSINKNRMSLYAAPYSENDFKKLVRFTHSGLSLLDTPELDIDRHRASNWNALGKHGTFEFRAFNSTNDPTLLSIQVDFMHKLVKAVRQRDPRLITMLKSPNMKGINLKNLADGLNCKLAEPALQIFAKKRSSYEVTKSKRIAHTLRGQDVLRFNLFNLSQFGSNQLNTEVGRVTVENYRYGSSQTSSSITFTGDFYRHGYNSQPLRPPSQPRILIPANQCLEFYR